MAQAYLSQIIPFACNFAPRGFASCNGQLLPIQQNSALFALLGTTYGGNGTTTFGLPDLRGRVPLHFGQGPGLSNYTQGQVGGTETVTIGVNNMPSHTHATTQAARAGQGNSDNPVGNIPASSGSSENFTAPTQSTGNMGGLTVSATGGGQPISNVQPYVVLNWCITTEGIFPARN